MSTNDSLMLYAKLAGFRLIVIANRFGSDDDFSRELHDRLIGGLDAAIDRVRTILAWERRCLEGGDEFAAYQLAGEIEIFERLSVELLDELDIDRDTYEYRINGHRWTSALMVDDRGSMLNILNWSQWTTRSLVRWRQSYSQSEWKPVWLSGLTV